MNRPEPTDDQARFRAELRRSGALRNGIALGFLDQRLRSVQDRLTAWLRRPPAAKEAARGPVAQQDRAAVS